MVENLAHRLQRHQHVSLLAGLGEDRRVDLEGAAAELAGKLRREVVDVGEEIALHAARRRHHRHVHAARRAEGRYDGLDAAPAGYADRVAVLEARQKEVGRRLASRGQIDVVLIGDRRRDDRLLKVSGRCKLLLDLEVQVGEGGSEHPNVALDRLRPGSRIDLVQRVDQLVGHVQPGFVPDLVQKPADKLLVGMFVMHAWSPFRVRTPAGWIVTRKDSDDKRCWIGPSVIDATCGAA